ncbi:MAG: hypothetical protein WBZ20_14065 [Nitrososphaeraceae archaeon]
MFCKETFTYLRRKGAKLLPTKIFPIRIGLLENGAQTTNDKTTEMVVGNLNFGRNGPWPHFMYSLRIVSEHAGIDNQVTTLQATKAH